MSTKDNLKTPYFRLCPSLDFDRVVKYPKDYTNQKGFGKEYKVIYPSSAITNEMKYLEFELKDTENVWSFGASTRFSITGRFECMTPATGDTPATPWTGVTADDVNSVVVSPNFLDVLIRSFNIYHGNNQIRTSHEDDFISPYLNMWKYNYMDKWERQLLCPKAACPGNGIPSKKNGWSFDDENSEWRKEYGPNIFVGDKDIQFDWVPLDVPPFFQGNNYLDDAHREWPMPILDKIRILILFHEHPDSIFEKRDGNNKMYRFTFKEFNLNVEYWRLNPLFKEIYLKSKEDKQYFGVTRLQKCLKIPPNVPVFRYEFSKIPYPEGIFIFALNKKIPEGSYTYSKNSEGTVFEKHNIQQIAINYDHQPLFVETPHIGQINVDQIEYKILTDWLNSPPFGMKMDKDKITLKNVADGSINTPFPHVFVNLCNTTDKTSRIIPLNRDPSVLKEDRFFELTINFKQGGATPDVVYIVYFYYTDVNLIIDNKNTFGPIFRSPYLRMI